jgi:hypothetical protein
LPLLIVVRFLLSLVSLAILLAAGYLLVEWYDGTIYVRETDGSLIRHREQWMLWLGVAALAFFQRWGASSWCRCWLGPIPIQAGRNAAPAA